MLRLGEEVSRYVVSVRTVIGENSDLRRAGYGING